MLPEAGGHLAAYEHHSNSFSFDEARHCVGDHSPMNGVYAGAAAVANGLALTEAEIRIVTGDGGDKERCVWRVRG